MDDTSRPGKPWAYAGVVPVAVAASVSAALAPHPLAPGSLAAILPALFLSYLTVDHGEHMRILVPFAAVSLYLLASAPLLAGARQAWHICVALFGGTALACASFFLYFWSFGIKYQGAFHTWSVLGLNVVCASLVGTALVLTRGQSASRAVALCQVALFCWIDYAAFPWLGETF